jgi:hypothetical protein
MAPSRLLSLVYFLGCLVCVQRSPPSAYKNVLRDKILKSSPLSEIIIVVTVTVVLIRLRVSTRAWTTKEVYVGARAKTS